MGSPLRQLGRGVLCPGALLPAALDGACATDLAGGLDVDEPAGGRRCEAAAPWACLPPYLPCRLSPLALACVRCHAALPHPLRAM